MYITTCIIIVIINCTHLSYIHTSHKKTFCFERVYVHINKPRAAGFYKVLFLESRSSELARSELWLPGIYLSSTVETESLNQTAGNSMGLETESDYLVVDGHSRFCSSSRETTQSRLGEDA
jgi:hypothetical protein